ncbi:unnamed protein product [Parnassius apollo]|uniref:(apollo) hypothetical protein n=1 Tax=Parnassius apollo TaxID=110799 RepID=A0A8S3WY61_PARAO|nr:unnamed protein product [Parnassius apollo]
MLVFCGIANPLRLWDKYRHLSEDFLRAPRCTTGDNTEATDERVLNSSLSSLQDMAISIGGSSLVDYGLLTPQHLDVQERGNREYNSEINYDPRAMSTMSEQLSACSINNNQAVENDENIWSVRHRMDSRKGYRGGAAGVSGDARRGGRGVRGGATRPARRLSPRARGERSSTGLMPWMKQCGHCGSVHNKSNVPMANSV